MQKKYRITYKRRFTQSFFLLLYFLFPFLGLFYFDSVNNSFVLLGKNVGVNNSVMIVIGFMILLFGVITMAITTGRSFCGWVCPQNFLSEIINKIILKTSIKSNGKKKIFPYTLIFLATIIISLAVAINFMFYFGKPEDIFRMLISGEMNGNIMTFAIMFFLLVFSGIGLFRHDFCKYACPYGIMQASVADKTTLRVRFAKERSSDCIDCDACTDICYVDIEPRKLVQADPGCMNCGLCVEACHNVLEPLGVKSMLDFTAEKDPEKKSINATAVFINVSGFLIFTLYFLYMFITLPFVDLMITRNDKHVSVVKNGILTSRYFLNTINQTSKEIKIDISFEGLPEKYFVLDKKEITLQPAEKQKIDFMILALKSDMKAGIRKFSIIAKNSGKIINKTDSSLFIPFE
ncbi:MAG: 4Fe-4S binding protein [Cyanobacteriota bacterium]